MTSLGAFLLLRTTISRLELAIMIACFSAIVCIVFFKNQAEKSSEPLDVSVKGMTGLFFAFCCAVNNSVVNVTTKKLERIPKSTILTL